MSSSTSLMSRPQDSQARPSPLGPGLSLRMAALTRVQFRLDQLPSQVVSLDLRGPEHVPACPGEGLREGLDCLAWFLAEASIPLLQSPPDLGAVVLDAPAFLDRPDQASGAARDLGLALFLVAGALGRVHGPGLGLGVAGLPQFSCRLLEDRLAWLRANRILIRQAEPGIWLPPLARAFQEGFGLGY